MEGKTQVFNHCCNSNCWLTGAKQVRKLNFDPKFMTIVRNHNMYGTMYVNSVHSSKSLTPKDQVRATAVALDEQGLTKTDEVSNLKLLHLYTNSAFTIHYLAHACMQEFKSKSWISVSLVFSISHPSPTSIPHYRKGWDPLFWRMNIPWLCSSLHLLPSKQFQFLTPFLILSSLCCSFHSGWLGVNTPRSDHMGQRKPETFTTAL